MLKQAGYSLKLTITIPATPLDDAHPGGLLPPDIFFTLSSFVHCLALGYAYTYKHTETTTNGSNNMNAATFNEIVLIAQQHEVISLLQFAEIMEEAGYNKAEVAKRIMHSAWAFDRNSEAYRQIMALYNQHLKAAA